MQYDLNGNILKKSLSGQGPNLQIAGPATICQGDTLEWTASGAQTYLWSTGATTPTLQTVPPASGQYSVTATAANGCTAVKSRGITVLPKPALGYIQKTSAPGAPGPAAYTTVHFPGATYTWTAPDGLILSGQGTPTVQVQWNAGSLEQLSVYAVSQQGCTSDTLRSNPAGEDEQFIPLNQGWNLVSTYLAPFDYSTPAVFKVLEQSGVLLRVKTIDKLYTPGIPPALNSLQETDDGAGYWVRVAQPATWYVKGLKLDPLSTPIPLAQGWNLIGYIPNHALPVQDALAAVMPKIGLVKNIYSSFNPTAPPVLNTLKQLEPGQGYWVRMKEAATLIYPADKLTGPNDERISGTAEADWHSLVTAYPNSTAAYGRVTLNGLPVTAGQLILATAGNEVRGAGRTVLHEGQSYVTLVLNGTAPAEEVAFHLVQGNDVLGSAFRLLTTPGDVLETYLPLAFGDVNRTGETGTHDLSCTLYPNPATGFCTLDLERSEATTINVRLSDLSGKRSWLLARTELLTGDRTIPLDLGALSLPAGMYFIDVQSNKGVRQFKMFLQSR